MTRFKTFFITLLGAIVMLAFAPQAWDTIERGWYTLFPKEVPQDVASTESAEELARRGLRNQLVSFETLYNIDHGQYDYFAMGVGQVTLKTPEVSPNSRVSVTGSRQPKRDYNTLSPVTTVGSQQFEMTQTIERVRPYAITGRFNNVLVFGRKANTFSMIFEKRLMVSRFQTGWLTPQDILIVFATDTDSDGDGDLTSSDLQDLFIYTFADKQVHRIALPGMAVQDIVAIPKADHLIVQYRVDRNHDGEIGQSWSDTGEEPSTFMRIDLKTFEAKPLVPGEIVQALQKNLEGVPAAP